MKTRIFVLIAIFITGVLIAGFINLDNLTDPESSHNRSEQNRLKIFNPSDVNPTLVDSSIQDVTKDHVIGEFSFLNQLGEEITNEDVKGKIYVTDFFFTTCGGICPELTTQLHRLQSEFSDDDNFLILSHTVNPSYDSVSIMMNYAERFEANHDKWWFLTGDKKELYLMARKSYLVVPDENDPNFDHGDESDFIHTENFALIDPDGRIRGMCDGTNPDEVSELILDIYDLKKEYGFE